MVLGKDNPLAVLAWWTHQGDPAAAEAFCREMRRALEGMVRLALRKRIGFSSFEEFARAQANRLQQGSDWRLPQDELTRQTAERVCDAMMNRLQSGSPVCDTVACAGSFAKCETVAIGP